MPNYKYESGFAEDIEAFLQYKTTVCGFNEKTYSYILKKFDRFCVSRNITTPTFSREDAEEWIRKQESEKTTTHYKRVNIVKHFLTYELARGRQVFVVRDVRSKPSNFMPHIYTDDETNAYFRAVDSFTSGFPKDSIQFPVFFRILHCCGTRVNETLSIRKNDVDLENGVITLRQTKGNKERYVVTGEDLKALMKTFSEKCFHEIAEDGLIFTNSRGNKIDHKKIHDAHRQFLKKAGIPYLGEGEGPRLHDWRHRFAIYAFKKMADSGLDMYVALPILAAYLGHENISATEGYIRLAVQHFPSIGEKIKDKVKAIFGDMENEDN